MKVPGFFRYGRLVVIALLGLAIVLVLSQVGRRGNPNPRPVAYLGSDGVPEVMLEQNQLDQYVVTGRINGERIEFLIDTGSADVALPYAVAQRLGLRLHPGAVSKTGNGNVRSWTAWLDSVDVGGLVAQQVKATVLPNMAGEQALLGMAYLKHMEVWLAGGQMRLRPYVSP
ncbi:retropepsin-like aspartic protease family protein [Allochromatium palmeri]|uniref:TIGR02281 family clan AA aspartic protease n=1 Tax=Allochromatium palmeri TaxID=231048 RepID=A0A6N8E643_9GAMM|nr:TIGR02281 family clan AA aspartic protease [Allochromatium palmeri]MTW19672.1 TIGR02281 family clan AA aspartic protease [Allochromatium palmeri]